MSSKPKKIDEKAEQLRIDSIRAKFLEQDVEEDEVKYQTIVEYCKQFQTTFHDGEFPHTDENLGKHILKKWRKPKSLLKKKLKTDKDKKKLDQSASNDFIHKNAKWHRLFSKESIGITWKLSLDIQYEIFQNGLSNCGLIAALSAVSAHPSLIYEVFRNLELNEYGVYQVTLCVDGQWKTVTVDDWVPCVKGESVGAGMFFFNVNDMGSISKMYQIWPALVEKAIAKVCGGYERIYGFVSATAMHMMTGAPAVLYWTESYSKKVDDLWKILKESRSKNYLMTCGTSLPKNKRLYERNVKKLKEPELARRHCYTIISVIEVCSRRMLRLRNPWGRSEWNGRWSTKWNGWTDEMILQLLVFQAVDISGSFWIELEDWIKYFDNFSICRWRDHWYEIRMNMVIGGQWDGTQKSVRVSVPKTCKISITALIPKNPKNQKHYTWISIYRLDDFEEVLFCEPIEKSSEDIELLSGDYMILASAFTNHQFKQERNIVIHSSIPISARFCDWNPMKMVRIFQKTVENKGRELITSREDVSIKRYESEDFVVVMAQNYSHDEYLHVHTRCFKADYCSLSRGDRLDTDYGDVIPPKSSQIIIIRYLKFTTKHHKFPMNIEYFLSKEKVTKMGRSNRAEHIPEIKPSNYIHQTIVLE